MKNKFVIGKNQLAEMALIATKLNLDTSSLSWTEVQQVLTLKSLEEFMKLYGIEVEFEVSIEDEK